MEVKVMFKDPSYIEPPLCTAAPGRLGDGPLVPQARLGLRWRVERRRAGRSGAVASAVSGAELSSGQQSCGAGAGSGRGGAVLRCEA